MRISFSIELKELSGKHKFAVRLAQSLRSKGIEITDSKPDINIVFVKGVRKNCKNVFRLDGILMNTRVNFKKKNKQLLNTIKSCDGLIYQSQFCKDASDHFLGKFKKSTIILNGASAPDVSPKKLHRPYILTFCRWRAHKRLKDTVRGFLHSGIAKDYDLVVLGEDPDFVVKDASVLYKGKKTGKKLWSYIKGCEYIVHLAYIDWCPNSVVEALVCGKNVLHSSTGGTKDVVRGNGIVIQDKPWDFTPIDLYKPPDLDLDVLANAYRDMFKLLPPKVEYLDINVTAHQYIEYCRSILIE